MNPTKCYTAKAADVEERWYLLDAKDQILGRVATQAASLLRGKHNPKFTPSMDLGEHVIIINAAEIKVTGRKMEQKLYRHHTLYMGGLREETLAHRLQRSPELVLESAVWGMLPKNKLGRKLLRKLRVYAGPEHNNQAQKPIPFELSE